MVLCLWVCELQMMSYTFGPTNKRPHVGIMFLLLFRLLTQILVCPPGEADMEGTCDLGLSSNPCEKQ